MKGPWTKLIEGGEAGPPDKTYRRWRGRVEFLQIVQRLYPEAAEDLEKRVRVESEKRASEIRQAERETGKVRDLEYEKAVSGHEALEAWAKRWNLKAPWILTYAQGRRLSALRCDPPQPVTLADVTANTESDFSESVHRIADVYMQGLKLPSIGQKAPEWVPALESGPAYRKRVKEYIGEVEEAYRAEGWEETSERPKQRIHLEWLALLDVGSSEAAHEAKCQPDDVGLGVADIAERFGVTEQQVRYGISKMRKLLINRTRIPTSAAPKGVIGAKSPF